MPPIWQESNQSPSGRKGDARLRELPSVRSGEFKAALAPRDHDRPADLLVERDRADFTDDGPLVRPTGHVLQRTQQQRRPQADAAQLAPSAPAPLPPAGEGS